MTDPVEAQRGRDERSARRSRPSAAIACRHVLKGTRVRSLSTRRRLPETTLGLLDQLGIVQRAVTAENEMPALMLAPRRQFGPLYRARPR